MDHHPVFSESIIIHGNYTSWCYILGIHLSTACVVAQVPANRMGQDWVQIYRSYVAVRELPVDGVVFVYGIYKDVAVAATKIEKKQSRIHQAIELSRILRAKSKLIK